MKKILLSILLLFCLGFSGINYAENNTQLTDDGTTICTTDTFSCPSGLVVSRVLELNCEFAPCPQFETMETTVSSETTNDSENSVQATTTESKKDCQEQVKNLNQEINTNKQGYNAELAKVLPEYNLAKSEYLKALDNYKMCLSEKISNIMSGSSSTSGMTANAAVTNIMEDKWVKRNFNTLSEAPQPIANATTEVTTTDDFGIDVPEVPETNSNDCKDQRAIAKAKLVAVKEKIQEIKALKEKYHADFENINLLETQRQEIIRNCYPQNPAAECKIPEELITDQKEMSEQLLKLQTDFASNGSTDKETFISEYKPLKDKYNLISEKINAIKQNCQEEKTRKCEPDAEVQKAMEEIRNKLSVATDETEAYALKTKLRYYEDKAKIKCEIVNPTVQPASVGEPSKAMPATSSSINSEIETYRQQIQELKTQIQAKDQEIKKLKGSIETIRLELKNTGQERKAEVLAENADKILTHTTEVLDKRIAELKEKITNIESLTDMSEENKQKIIDNLNNRIGALELVKSKLEDATTPQELREIINSARIAEENAIVENRLATLQNSISKLGDILENHFSGSKKYESYKSELSGVSGKASNLTFESTKEEISAVILEYQELKQKILSENPKKAENEVNN